MNTIFTQTRLIGRLIILLIILSLGAPPGQAAASSPDAPGWMQSNTSGFGDPSNANVSVLKEFDGQLYAATWRASGAQVWRSPDGKIWSQFNPPFAAAIDIVSDAIEYGGRLYLAAGSESGGVAELWRTNGSSWTKVNANGFGDSDNTGFYALAAFENNLYVATGNIVTGTEIWRSSSGSAGSWTQVNEDGFGRGASWPSITMDAFNGYLYIGQDAQGNAQAELWRSPDGVAWEPVFEDGLGTADNSLVTAMAEFEDAFYIGVRNTATGGEVWRASNGNDWEKVASAGLGNMDNKRPYGLFVFEDQLHLAFSNLASGAEVWRSPDGEHWQLLVAGGWGDAGNTWADYLDKAAAEFKDSLYIGTLNETDGGEIWNKLHPVYLPTIARPEASPSCSVPPFLLSPNSGAQLDTIIPLFRWDNGSDPQADESWMEVARDPDFNQLVAMLISTRTQGVRDFRYSFNFDPATTYYWRTWLVCNSVFSPYSAAWSFTTGSGGEILPAPALLSPPDGSNISGSTVTLEWSPVGGAVQYLAHVRPEGENWHYVIWVSGTQVEVSWLESGKSYDWWVAGRNDYAIGQESAPWRFTMQAALQSGKSIPEEVEVIYDVEPPVVVRER